jgi:hypothetical protein
MADLAIALKVFLASPSDVSLERDIAEHELLNLQQEYADKRLLLNVYRWEREVTPTFHRVQGGINTQLRAAELVIAVLWSTLGTPSRNGESGSQEELRIARDLVARGCSDDVFLYFKSQPPPPSAGGGGVEAVAQFRKDIIGSQAAFAIDFDSADAFRERLRRDLRNWIARWLAVPDVCAYAFSKLPGGPAPSHVTGENRLALLKQYFDPTPLRDELRPIASQAVWMYQAHGEAAAEMVFEIESSASGWFTSRVQRIAGEYERLVEAGVMVQAARGVRFANPEWFYLFCAIGLADAVALGDLGAVERRRYVNPVHQYLQALCVGDQRTAVVGVLRRWLLDADGVTGRKPIARDFAAYVLGMLGATEAHEDLAHVIAHDTAEAVRMYCVASLGRMRARAQLPMLTDLFRRPNTDDMRLMIALAVSRMVGVADYPL